MADAPQSPPPIEPMDGPGGMSLGKKIAAAIVAATIAATPVATSFEGFSGKVYLDPAHIPTQGYGETEDIDPTRIWTKDEGMARLRRRMAQDYAPPLIKCVPSFVDHHNAFGAALDAAYNAGPRAVCRSPMARAFNRGDYPSGCAAFVHWYDSTSYRGPPRPAATMRNNGWKLVGKRWVKQLAGLVKRRKAESALCMKDL
jgi:lysozyme